MRRVGQRDALFSIETFLTVDVAGVVDMAVVLIDNIAPASVFDGEREEQKPDPAAAAAGKDEPVSMDRAGVEDYALGARRTDGVWRSGGGGRLAWMVAECWRLCVT